jgi:uncharacterized SAM-binding protein YcdF (DUF218 family)
MVRDLRRYAKQTNFQLIIGGLLLLFLVGDGLIYLIYGRSAAILGFVCLLAGMSPLALIWLALSLMDWIVRRANR